MPKDTEKYLLSCGIRNALYSIRASDLTGDLFGTLVPCPFPQHPSARGEPSSETLTKKWSQEVAWSDYGTPTAEANFSRFDFGDEWTDRRGLGIRFLLILVMGYLSITTLAYDSSAFNLDWYRAILNHILGNFLVNLVII
ncbi:unnamed protein product [Fraxinus pennsylvanica]|uniref:Uncharacterized protein n=1 Tax=Fraxinus pennsylvanica TaxID=56036 RepID=A0AAD2DYH7_9LAMI|nr:unnamed protein product [Fraxinus pennsylvanica]